MASLVVEACKSKSIRFLLNVRKKEKKKKSLPNSKLVACLNPVRNYGLRIASRSGTCGHNKRQSPK